MCSLPAGALPPVQNPLKELLLLNERLGMILQLNDESLEMPRLFFFFPLIFFFFFLL